MGWDAFRTTVINGRVSQAVNVLNDIPGWPRWDVDLKKCTLFDDAAVPALGVKGQVEMNNGKTFPIEFVDVDLPKSVAYRTVFPGVKLDWYWEFPADMIRETEYTLKMGVRAEGWLSPLWGLALKGQCEQAFEKCVPLFKKYAEEEKP